MVLYRLRVEGRIFACSSRAAPGLLCQWQARRGGNRSIRLGNLAVAAATQKGLDGFGMNQIGLQIGLSFMVNHIIFGNHIYRIGEELSHSHRIVGGVHLA